MPDLRGPTVLLGDGVLDPDLAALVWLLLEARTPLVVVGRPRDDRDRVVDGLAAFLPDAARVLEIRPDDEFESLPDAAGLGWRTGSGQPAPSGVAILPEVGVLRVRGLAAPDGIGGDRARLVVRALALGYGLLATMDGEGLGDVVDALRDPSVGADADELSRLGVVLSLGTVGGRRRIVTAHYMRPVASDVHGHVQRPAPALLATWSEDRGAYDDFSWGVAPDLSGRLGIRPVDLDREQARRASILRAEGVPG